MPKLTDAQLAKAAKRFLENKNSTAAAARIQAITQAEADFMETSLEQLRLQRTMAEIDQHARENGLDSMELRFSLASDTTEEFAKLCAERQATIDKALGK